jgi:hypothetical protein
VGDKKKAKMRRKNQERGKVKQNKMGKGRKGKIKSKWLPEE